MANYVIPLVTVPYLTRILGVEAWGEIALAQVVLQYFILLVDYGFSWSAVRQISEERGDRDAISRIFNATWCAQWLLLGVSVFILFAIVIIIPMLRNVWQLYVAGFAVVLGQVLFPIWLMQGLERLREVAAIQFFTRLLLILPIFLLVNSPEDILLAMVIQSIGGVISGVLCLYLINRDRIIIWRWPSWVDVWCAFKSGGELFLSRGWISLYTHMIPLILGIVAGTTAVGIYSLADRIRNMAQSLLQPISQAVFPRMSHLYAHDVKEAQLLLVKSLSVVFVVAAPVSLGLFVMADWIILVIGGSKFHEAADVLRWLSIVPLAVGLSNVFGVQVMIPNGRVKAFNLIVGIAGICAIVSIFPFSSHYGAVGAARVTLIVELIVTGMMAFYLQRAGFFQKIGNVLPKL